MGVLTQVKSFGPFAETPGDVVRPIDPIRRHDNIDPTLAQEIQDFDEMIVEIIGVEVLDKMATQSDIDTGRRHPDAKILGVDKLKRGRGRTRRQTRIDGIHGPHAVQFLGQSQAQITRTRPDLEKARILG